MKRLLLYRFFILILAICASIKLAAQDDATSRFIDSASKPAVQKIPEASEAQVTDTVVAAEETVDSTTTEEFSIDTAIVSKLRSIRQDSFSLIKKDKGFYYQKWLDSLLRAEEANMKPKPKPKSLDLSKLDLFFTIFQTILWVLAGAIVLFVIYKLFLSKGALFIKNRKNIDANIETEEPVNSAGHYDNLLRKAEAAGDYRLAVRYQHLQTLYNLSEKGYIVFGTDKTNYQYVNELRKAMPSLVNVFAGLTRKYEYIWYGEYAIAVDNYNLLKNEFASFNNPITTV
ncbi:MAG: hypothetical protein QM726_21100 [Chitinophagaceae bacterium]